MLLNIEQEAAIKATESKVLVLAPAASGQDRGINRKSETSFRIRCSRPINRSYYIY